MWATSRRRTSRLCRALHQGTKGCWWNSLAVIDTGIVVAVGGLGGKISIVKGYPMKQFQVPFATPQIDGRITTTDGYYHPSARQVPMGNETGTFSYTDFAYDLDNLYMACVVFRSGATSEQPYPDGVNLYIESKGASTDRPLASAYRFTILPDGSLSASKGNGTDWAATEVSGVQVGNVLGTSYYRLEVAIPWTSIGLSTAPIMSQGQNISVNLETLTSGDGTQLVERIPDAQPQKPSTWVPLNIIEANSTGIKPNGKWTMENGMLYDISGRRLTSLPSGRFRGAGFISRTVRNSSHLGNFNKSSRPSRAALQRCSVAVLQLLLHSREIGGYILLYIFIYYIFILYNNIKFTFDFRILVLQLQRCNAATANVLEGMQLCLRELCKNDRCDC